MVKDRAGYHTIVTQIPDVLWQKLRREAEQPDGNGSATRVLIRVLAEHYGVPLGKLPKPKKPGRKSKRK